MTPASAEHWEVRTGGKCREDRWVEVIFNGWVRAEWQFSAREDRWYQTRKPRTDDMGKIPADPEIPADVLADAHALMEN